MSAKFAGMSTLGNKADAPSKAEVSPLPEPESTPSRRTPITAQAPKSSPSVVTKTPDEDDFEALRPPGSDKLTGPTKLEDLSPEQKKILDDFRDRIKQTTSEEWYRILLAEKAKKDAAEKISLLQKSSSDGNPALPSLAKGQFLRDHAIQSEQEDIVAKQQAERERLEKGLAELDLAAKETKASTSESGKSKARIDSWLDTVHGDAVLRPVVRENSLKSSNKPEISSDTRKRRVGEIHRRARRDLRMADWMHDQRLSLCNDYREVFSTYHSAVQKAIVSEAESAELEVASTSSLILPSITVPTIVSTGALTMTESIPDEISSGSVIDTGLGQYLRLGRRTAFGRAKTDAPVRIYHTDRGDVHDGIDVPIAQYLREDQIAQLKYLANQHGKRRLSEFQVRQRLAVTRIPLVAPISESVDPTTVTTSSNPAASGGGSGVATPVSTPSSSVIGAAPPTPGIAPIVPLIPVDAGEKPGPALPNLDDADMVSTTGCETGDEDTGGDKGGGLLDDGASEIGDTGSMRSDMSDDVVTTAPTT